MLNRTFGCVRVVWNRTLAWRHQRYHGEQVKTGFIQANAYLTAMKRDPDLAWLTEVSSVPLQQAIGHRQVAYTNFFAKRAGYPRFKSRTDLSVKDFAVTSGGQKIANPRTLARRAQALARYQRRLARCQRGSANRAKARAKVARAHRKVRASRTDFLHRTSARLVRDHDVIVIEDLAVKNMVRNRSLAKAISDCGWGTFRAMLEYKAAKYGRHVIDRWYPSSKTCSACGHLLAELSLNTRHWTCPSCGTRHDRDINAATNIRAAGLAVPACGADVRPQGTPLRQPAVKQEPPGVSPGIPVVHGRE